MNLKIFPSQSEQILGLTNEIHKVIAELLKKKDSIVIAVSGGKSPIPLFDKLSTLDLPWDKIIITLVDERIVDTASEDSNENLVKTHLLRNKAQNVRFIGLVDISKSISDMLYIADTTIPEIDIAILGIGEDGHTASIFPCCKELDAAIDMNNQHRYINTNPVSARYSRISLTLNALVGIPALFLSISGDLKLKVFNEALKAENKNYPISYLLNLRNDLITYYYE